ncbi:hypothetical protein IAI51_12745 [Pseudomonas sp. N40(2020)]|uniref:hypothetical protein n=1 Tax=Pseudomonas sp. N40(2020) TaxID=2767798 RepID=UPI0016572C4C|nr:hypothetical protein [Pseudomonas sp. N40(2020)]MBC8997398.1 hypothetical protein [Pseudomonas sp. N40(2020)]
MSLRKNNNNAFTANLYFNGFPVVLNQQRLRQRLREPRITRSDKLDAEVCLADKREPGFITLAEHEDDKPLLLEFSPHGETYTIKIVLRGGYDGARLYIENGNHNLLVSQEQPAEFFSITRVEGTKLSLDDLDAGPVFINLISESSKKPLYRDTTGRMSIFKNVDPNLTGHVAFNNKPAIFVIKVIDKLPVGA